MMLTTMLLADAVNKYSDDQARGKDGKWSGGGSGGGAGHGKFEVKGTFYAEDESGVPVRLRHGTSLTLDPDSISDKSAGFVTSNGARVYVDHRDTTHIVPAR